MLILLGTDDALFEGLVQLLASTGQKVCVARSMDEAEELGAERKPLLVLADRGAFVGPGADRLARFPLAPGGALVAFHGSSDPEDGFSPSPALARLTMADLELPLERNRLMALTLYIAARARDTGRIGQDTPPEQRAL